MDDLPSLSVSRALTGFLLRWVAAWILPGGVTVPTFMVSVYLGDRYSSPAFFYLAIAVLLSQPVLLAVAHGRLMRGRLRRPRLWGVMTGGGVAMAALATALMLNLFDVIAAFWPSIGRLALLAQTAISYAATGLLVGLVIGLLQCTALGPPWRDRFGWCAVSVLGSLAALAWMWAWSEIDGLSDWAAGVTGSLFERDEWFGVPAVTVWIATVVLLHALPTGLAMRRLLRRRHAAESAAMFARFD